jgi:membrane protease YdiL (CAAX protease family)
MKKMLGPILLALLLAQLVAIQVLTLLGAVGSLTNYIFVAIAYVVIVGLLWLERNHLSDFQLDRFALGLLVISAILRTRLGVNGEGYFLLVFGLCGITMAVLLLRQWSSIPTTSRRWCIIGLVVGCLAVVPSAILESSRLQPTAAGSVMPVRIIPLLLRGAVYQISFTVLVEEYIFRVLLWGYLVRLGWKESHAMWTQGILFWLLHFTQANVVGHFFVAVPLTTVIYTILTKRSRQVSPAIISHTVINTITPLVLTVLRVVSP